MNNVIPFPTTRPAKTDTFYKITVAELLASDYELRAGDHVYVIEFRDAEEGGVVLSVPGPGTIRNVTTNRERGYIKLTFDFNCIATVSGDTVLKWSPK